MQWLHDITMNLNEKWSTRNLKLVPDIGDGIFWSTRYKLFFSRQENLMIYAAACFHEAQACAVPFISCLLPGDGGDAAVRCAAAVKQLQCDMDNSQHQRLCGIHADRKRRHHGKCLGGKQWR